MEEAIEYIETPLETPLSKGINVSYGILSTNCRDADEIVTIYGALRTYMKVLVQQPDEDLETIARVTRLMIAIKPQAVEASQEIAGREK